MSNSTVPTTTVTCPQGHETTAYHTTAWCEGCSAWIYTDSGEYTS